MKIAPRSACCFVSMQDKAIRNGTIIALVIVVLQPATTTGRHDAGVVPALAVATGFTLLFVIASQRIPLSEWRRYQVALVLLVITQFVVTWK
jgi:hypothetical protein